MSIDRSHRRSSDTHQERQSAGKPEVSLASSKLKKGVLKVLKDEGYIADFRPVPGEGHETLTVDLKYFEGKPVIDRIERVSRRACGFIAARMSCPRF